MKWSRAEFIVLFVQQCDPFNLVLVARGATVGRLNVRFHPFGLVIRSYPQDVGASPLGLMTPLHTGQYSFAGEKKINCEERRRKSSLTLESSPFVCPIFVDVFFLIYGGVDNGEAAFFSSRSGFWPWTFLSASPLGPSPPTISWIIDAAGWSGRLYDSLSSISFCSFTSLGGFFFIIRTLETVCGTVEKCS